MDLHVGQGCSEVGGVIVLTARAMHATQNTCPKIQVHMELSAKYDCTHHREGQPDP